MNNAGSIQALRAQGRVEEGNEERLRDLHGSECRGDQAVQEARSETPSSLRRCRACGEEKPKTEEHFRRYKGKRALGTMCRACDVRRAAQWRAKNPAKTTEHRRARQRVLRERSRALQAIQGKATSDDVDALRRALAENPPEIASEGERLAYFRGFLAACKRSKDEESKLLAFQDLVFRIASELAAKRKGWAETDRFSYEEMVSWGYEAVLEVVRKKGKPSRADVAGAIRHRIADAARAQFGRLGTPRRDALKLLRASQGGALGEDGEEARAIDDCGASDPEIDDGVWDVVRARASCPGVDPRLAEMLELRAEGMTFAKIGERFGITESRACQVFAEHRDWMERELTPLAAV